MKDFDNFVKRKIVKVQAHDKSRAEFLIKTSENSYLFLQEKINKIGVDNKNANDYVESCYNILMGLIRAKMLFEGYNATGQGAHEAEIAYLKVLGFEEADIMFADEVRYFRNGMLYYGTILDKEYAEKVIEFTKRIYKELMEILSK